MSIFRAVALWVSAFAVSVCISGCDKFDTREKCKYPDDIASDGSRCGNRASSVRAGGK